jgi:hypothetical protein
MLLGMGGVMFVAYWGGHAKPHYLIASLPFFLLFVGYRFTMLRQLLPTHQLRSAFLALFGVWVAVASVEHVRFYMWAFYDQGSLYAAELPGVDTPSLVSYIQANTRPTDKIWVYYNAPEIYWLADRPAATQEPTGTWLTEHYGPLWIDRTYNEFQADKPALLVGFDKVRYDEGKSTPKLQELARMGDVIAKSYTCSDNEVPGTTICKRNPEPGN